MKPTTQFHRGLMALAGRSAALILALASANVASAQLNNTTNGPNAVTTNGTGAGAGMTTGDDNSAYGFSALMLNNTGSKNTAVGSLTLQSNTSGVNNTAVGFGALTVSVASGNTALGSQALQKNTSGANNTGTGSAALVNTTVGSFNTAHGSAALFKNTTGSFNTATGREALHANIDGTNNSAFGYQALFRNTGGDFNVAIGDGALLNTTGDGNIGIGEDGGFNLTVGSNNICIGNTGVAGEAGKIRIGTSGTHTETFLAGVIRGDGSGLTGITDLAANSVTTVRIANAAVTSAKLASGLTLGGTTTGTFSGNLTGNASTATSAVSFTGSLAGNVTGTQGATVIAPNAVTTARIANAAVTSAKLASGLTFAGATSVSGTINLPLTNAAGTAGVIKQNGNRLLHTFGTDNFFAGVSSGNFTMTGSGNTATGDNALKGNTTGNFNTAIGGNALQGNTTGSINTALGSNALFNNTTGAGNIALGNTALLENTTGVGNAAIGFQALRNNETGSDNIALGREAGQNITGDNNIDIGHDGVAGESNIIRIGATQTDTFLAGNVHAGGGVSAVGSISAGGGVSGVTGTFFNAINIPVPGGVSLTSLLTFNGTLFNFPADQAARRTADILSGFGESQFQFLSLRVGEAGGGNNDASQLTNEVMRLTGLGRVGIGTTAPAASLDVVGNGLFSGRVGIGTTTPAAPLDVTRPSGEHTMRLDNTSGEAGIAGVLMLSEGSLRAQLGYMGQTNQFAFASRGDVLLGSYNGADLRFDAAPDLAQLTRMFIESSNGNVGIGTTSPDTPLHVRATAELNPTPVVTMERDNDVQVKWGFEINGNTNLHVVRNGALVGFFTASGFTDNSDRKLKKDIVVVGPVLDKVMQLEPVSYRFKTMEETERPTYGFIAQDVEPLFPNVVKDNDQNLGITYTAMVPVAIAALQELKKEKDAEIAALKAANLALAEKLAALGEQLTALQADRDARPARARAVNAVLRPK